MASLEMGKSYDFDAKSINNVVTSVSAGNYALGYLNKNNEFVVQYVGRSDSDVRERLLQHIGEKYEAFKFSYATSPKAAFEKECKNYHDFGGEEGKLNNKIHPDIPNDSESCKCPYCKDSNYFDY